MDPDGDLAWEREYDTMQSCASVFHLLRRKNLGSCFVGRHVYDILKVLKIKQVYRAFQF